MMFYICDPQKNTECKKTACHTLCFLTLQKEFKKDGTEGMTDYEAADLDARQQLSLGIPPKD